MPGKTTISRGELHRRFVEALADEAPDGTFDFDIDRCAPDADGCNWFPLARLSGWGGDVNHNLNAFRRVRAQLAESFNLAAGDDHEDAVGAAALEAATA